MFCEKLLSNHLFLSLKNPRPVQNFLKNANIVKAGPEVVLPAKTWLQNSVLTGEIIQSSNDIVHNNDIDKCHPSHEKRRRKGVLIDVKYDLKEPGMSSGLFRISRLFRASFPTDVPPGQEEQPMFWFKVREY